MSTRENCDKVLLIQADFDGELDAAQSAAIAGHREACAYCREAWEQLQAARHAVRRKASYHPASPSLRSRLDQKLVAAGLVPANDVPLRQSVQGRFSTWWRSLVAFGLGAAIATMAAVMFIQPVQPGDITDLVLDNHIRSLQPGHLVDIASNNQHNVKPWFDGKLNFAPPVKNLADQGFPLEGGRLDYLQDREIAALVYRGGLHTINMLIWPAPGDGNEAPQLIEKDGYNIIHWREKGMAIWAISDLNPAELQAFVDRWRAGS